MHLLSSIPFSLLILLPFVSCSQTVIDHVPVAQSTTLIDVLNADPDYTSLLKLLQRARLVPTLNKLNDSTLFAPTNDAIKRHSFWSSGLQSTDAQLRDNIQYQLRQELLYHLLNYSLPAIPPDQDPQVLTTLHYPRKPQDPPSRDPPPSPPWLPKPGGTLGGAPQRLRIASKGGKASVGVDAFGQGGAAILKGRVDAGNGVLMGIGAVLDVPPDLATVITQQNSVAYFAKIVTPDIVNKLNSTPMLTVFLPVDSAWNVLPPIERLYLESEWATDDIAHILAFHAVIRDGVHWSESFEPAVNLTTTSGSKLEIVKDPESGKTFVSTAELIQPDIYASNGVLHTVSSLLFPLDALKVTPEKYLLTLNCTSFVSMLHSVNLTSLINSTDAEYTILAPSDDVLSVFGGDEDTLPDKGTDELKHLLSYHFLPGKWKPGMLKDGMLIETALVEAGLNGGRQLLDVEVSNDGKKNKESSIRFGGASILGELIEVNNTVIYLISRPLLPPSDVLQSALPSLDFSSYLAAVFSTSLAARLKKVPSTTFIIPVNDAFKRLGGLVSAHLLSATSKWDLENVILHHVINGVEYTKALRDGSSQSYGTQEGSDLRVQRLGNGSIFVSASGGWTGMISEVTPLNTLTKTGVIHELSDVLLPRSVNLTIAKLVKAAKGSTMATMLARAGFEWVLNGTAPLEDPPESDYGFKNAGWTLLCPTDDAFKDVDLTQLYDDVDRLQGIVRQHLIPVPRPPTSKLTLIDAFSTNRPLVMDDSASYTTLHSKESAYGDIVFRQAGEDDERRGTGYVVGIKRARGIDDGRQNWARVLSWGRSTTNSGTGGVIQIDQLLVPYRPAWYIEYGAPSAVGVLGVGLIIAFFLGMRALWRRDALEATYEPRGGFGEESDEE